MSKRPLFSGLLSSIADLISGSQRDKVANVPRTVRRLQIERLEDRSMMAAGALDTTFSSDGRVTTAFNLGGSKEDLIADLAVQSNGRIVAVGVVQRNGTGDSDFGIARYLANGSLDASFSSDGKTTVAFDLGGNDYDVAHAVRIQSDGKIVVVGRATRNSSGDEDFAVARLNSNGSLDSTFSGDGKATVAFNLGGSKSDQAGDVAIQSNGRIVVVGQAERTNGDIDFGIARLTTSGSLDTTFSSDGKAIVAFDLGGSDADGARAVALQSDGRIVVGGYVQRTNATNRDFGIARLTTSGSLDTAFSSDGKAIVAFDRGGGDEDILQDLAIQSNGRIVAVGYTHRGNTGDYDFAVARLTTTGGLDTTFSSDGKAMVGFDYGPSGSRIDQAFCVKIQSDGKILLAGKVQRSSSGDYDFGVARLTASGSLDTTFSSDGRVTVAFDLGGTNEDSAAGIFVQSDGRIVIGGRARRTGGGDFDFALARLTAV